MAAGISLINTHFVKEISKIIPFLFCHFKETAKKNKKPNHRLYLPKWKANVVTVTINPQVLAFGEEPGRKPVPGYSEGEEPVLLNGGLESGG